MDMISIPAPADFHVHLRDGAMSKLVTPHVALGGIRTAYIMPNLQPPITTTAAALSYKERLQAIDPNIEYLMTLYLHENMLEEIEVEGMKTLSGVEEVRRASKAGVKGIKSYPKGVTTHSSGGIESYEPYYPIFRALEEEGMVLNLHGEVPSNDKENISVLNAEKLFLKHLRKLVEDFPRLKIVLEHATTREAVDCVKSLPDTVACTITAHHLVLTIDSVTSQPFHFCKPVAKEPTDRAALREVIASGHPRFFLGSDSAPHPVFDKIPKMPSSYLDAKPGVVQGNGPTGCAAGVYTSPVLLPLLASVFDELECLEKLPGFASLNGRRFYGMEREGREDEVVTLKRVTGGGVVPAFFKGEEKGIEVVPFKAGESLGWEFA